uniref:Chromodomain helicase DNA binding protein 9 n=1 Tax=Petromyzon marinus TaxID=7757 RepID=S4RN91_PETMA
MGLGKTIQSIAFLQDVALAGVHGPFLVIAPLSTIANWEREFRTWTDMNAVVFHGSVASRQMIQQYEMYTRDAQGRRGRIIRSAVVWAACQILVKIILWGSGRLIHELFSLSILPELHKDSYFDCNLVHSVTIYNIEEHKVLLTGTPLQNTVEELFSLLNFLEPARFPSESSFLQEFGQLKSEEQVQKLQAILKPMMLRRLKEDVEKNLAPKQETIIEVELTNIQKKYYRAILERNFSFLAKGAGQANLPNLMNTMMELRKCCNHPYLINGAEEKILSDFREAHGADVPDFYLQAMVQAAGKLVLIDKLLPRLREGGHKVLIFSQMVRCLDILEDYLVQKRYPYERIDGRVRGNMRQVAIDRFCKPDSDRFVFLLCTRAGGLGINLTAADTCIIFDSDWNPQNDLQAQARCHRIGQSKAVKVYRLITRNSYEREMFDKASLKLGLDRAVLQSMSGRENTTNGVQQMSKKEIEDLLRKGAYGAIMDEEDEGSKFCEEDIDQILQRRTHTITIESEGKGSTFAKASFVASGNRTDISLDDPNFWQKWAKKAEIDLESMHGKNSLVIDTPRIRKQVRQYTAAKGEDLAELSGLESDDERPHKGRRPHERAQGYQRTECFRVEKNLLIYGWGRWPDILRHGRFKRQLVERDVELICRVSMAYCLLHYRGDERIKGFMWDLITPSHDGQARTLQNHSGLSAPVPRGRKGKKVKSQISTLDPAKTDWLAKYNPESLLLDDGYKKHLKHHCNKVLLRVRMLYYLRQEVIGDNADRVFDGVDASEIDIWIPEAEAGEQPVSWWDADADKSLLIGVCKHGYEKYNSMRADPSLCFLERVGMPDQMAIAAEQRNYDFLADGEEFEDPEYKPGRTIFKNDMDLEDDSMSPGSLQIDISEGKKSEMGKLYWPSASALTARLRRLVTTYQRCYKQQQQRLEAQASRPPSDTAPPPPRPSLWAREFARLEKRQRWTRREEADFYRVVSTFGVEFDPQRRRFDWTRFRSFARLDKKTDDSLTRYFQAFVAMCRKVCRLPPSDAEDSLEPGLLVEPITEERASRTLYRIELLRKVRQQVLRHPHLTERLRLCQPSVELPSWWQCGAHDRELLLSAAKHGVSRTDYHMLNDPEFSFLRMQHECMTAAAATAGSRQEALEDTVAALEAPLRGVVAAHDILCKLQLPDLCLKTESWDVAELGEKILKSEPESPASPASPASVKEEGSPGAGRGNGGVKAEPGEPSPYHRSPGPPMRPVHLNIYSDMETHTHTSSTTTSSRRQFAVCCLGVSGSSSPCHSCQDAAGPGCGSQSHGAEMVMGAAVAVASCDGSMQSVEEGTLGGSSEALVAATEAEETGDGGIGGGAAAVANSVAASVAAAVAAPTSERPRASPHWPKDRIIINRVDLICHAVLKGKWPSRRRPHYELYSLASAMGVTVSASGTTATTVTTVAAATGPGSGAGQQGDSVSSLNRTSTLLIIHSKHTHAEKPPHSMLTPVVGDEQLRRVSGQDSGTAHTVVTFPTARLALWGKGLGSAGLSSPVQCVVARRGGRECSVLGVTVYIFPNNKKDPHSGVKNVSSQKQKNPSTMGEPSGSGELRAVVVEVEVRGGRSEAGDDAVRDALGEGHLPSNPIGHQNLQRLVVPKPTFHPHKPKQKRHRCRNPNKLDVNTLTGEERVPVVNKRTGRKMGGAMAPPMKDLPRWLEENRDFAVAPDWGDIVKQS